MVSPSRDKPPDRIALAKVVEQLHPGARLLRVGRLRGGITSPVHSFEIRTATGERKKFVLRRQPLQGRWRGAELAAKEFRLLRLLRDAGVPAPAPVLLDEEGHFFGTPAMVTSFDGQPLVEPRDRAAWLAELAAALLKVHAVTPANTDMAFLTTFLMQGMRDELVRGPAISFDDFPLGQRVIAALRACIDSIARPPPTLVHDDYWPGNTVWRRGRLSAIVDWTSAQIGDPRADVAECRISLALMRSVADADAFLAAYQALRPEGPLPDVWYFDLFRGIRVVPWVEGYLEGQVDLGLPDEPVAVVRGRLEQLLERSLGDMRL